MTLSEIERAIEGHPMAQRNLQVGLWAGRAIGFKGRALNTYVLDVMRADHELPGPEDVIDKINGDFVTHDVPLDAMDIARQIELQERLISRCP